MEHAEHHHHNWYVRRGGEVRGPFPAGLVSRYVLLGRLRLKDEVSPDGEQWLPVGEVPELIPEVLLDAARHRDDPEVQERLAAARRWADERRLPHDVGFNTDRRGEDDPDLIHHREVMAQRGDGRPGWGRLLQYGIVLAVVAAVVAIPLLLPPGEGPGEPDCDAPPAPGVNWSNCPMEGSELANVDLAGAYLRNADLRDAALRAANLSGAELSYANLASASLLGADLQGAQLKGANLRRARLNNADLRDADLTYADLTDASMDGADLAGARLDHAVWDKDILCLPGSVGECRLGRAAE